MIILNLSYQQKEAINHINGPALVLAVPGSGKTTVLIHRTFNLIDKKYVSPQNILSISFSKSSALDMTTRFETLFPHSKAKPSFQTIHSFAFEILRNYGRFKGISYKLIENNKEKINKLSVIKQIYFNISKSFITEDVLEGILSEISYVKNLLLSKEIMDGSYKSKIKYFNEVFIEYENFKSKHNFIDFDDMLSISLEILTRESSILDFYRKKFLYIQVDEGQDTSKVQLEIIKLLAKPHNNLFIVADDDQSIYGFRGASPKELFQLEKEYPKLKKYILPDNFRCSKSIVELSHKLIKNNIHRFNKEIQSSKEYGNPISYISFDDLDKQVDYIYGQLKDSQGSSAILYRNNISSIYLIEYFTNKNIAFRLRDSNNKFFSHWIINDILNFLEFSKDQANISLYEKIYYKKIGYVSKKMVNYCKSKDFGENVFNKILSLPSLEYYAYENIKDLKYKFDRLANLKPYRAISFIENDLAYLDYLREHSSKFGYSFEYLNLVLYNLKYISLTTSDLEDFIGKLNKLNHISKNSHSKNADLVLSTIHSSKGLEFDNVFLIDLIDGEFPSNQAIEDSLYGNLISLEEERRLFYVGMTRAKSNLTLTFPYKLNSLKNYPSRFIEELK